MTEQLNARIEIERKGVGLFELRGNFFDVKVDGKSTATLARYGDEVAFEVSPGPHTLQMVQDRYTSKELQFDAFSGGTIRFRTHGPMLWPRWLVSFALPKLSINLHRV